MVFAVWAARRKFAQQHSDVVDGVGAVLAASRDHALTHRETLIQAAVQETGFDAALLDRYFRVLRFTLGEREVRGMSEFAGRLAEFDPSIPGGQPLAHPPSVRIKMARPEGRTPR
jgi:chorismate dehydratase